MKTEPSNPEPLPLSLLNDYLYCPRRAALKVVEGWREANEHTVRGDIIHEHADLPGYEVAKGVTLLRALPVWSERLGLSGKCDIVEVELESNARPHPRPAHEPRKHRTSNIEHPTTNESPKAGTWMFDVGCWVLDVTSSSGVQCVNSSGNSLPQGEGERFRALRPVEYKRGKRRQWENDDVQLCAQALCLEEMLNVSIPRGAIFHADSKRRREVEFTPELRQTTENAIIELHALLNPQPSTLNPQLPRAIYKPACEECSLYEICLPKATEEGSRAGRLANQLFQI